MRLKFGDKVKYLVYDCDFTGHIVGKNTIKVLNHTNLYWGIIKERNYSEPEYSCNSDFEYFCKNFDPNKRTPVAIHWIKDEDIIEKLNKE